MELILLKSLKMFKYNEKYISKLYIFIFIMLLFVDTYECPEPVINLNKSINLTALVNTTSNITSVTSINTVKKQCMHTLADGMKVTGPCFNFTLTDVKGNISDSSDKKNNSTNTTEKSEIASMTDRSDKYTGGIDVDEKLITHNDIHLQNTTDSSVVNNHVNIKNNSDGSQNENYSSKIAEQQNDNGVIPKRLLSTTAAGIAAGLCILLASSAYISLLVWRNISYKRYGNREMLINEDDLGDVHDEDMRHFELKLLNREGKVIQ